MRVGHHYQTPQTAYGAYGKSRTGGRSRAEGDADAAAGAGEEKRRTRSAAGDTVELSGIAEEQEAAVVTASEEAAAPVEEPEEPEAATTQAESAEETAEIAEEAEESAQAAGGTEEGEETDETGAAGGSGAAGEAEETDEDEEAKALEEAKKAAEKAAEEAKKAEEQAAAEARKKALEAVKDDFKSYLNKLVFSPGLSKAPINVTISDAAFEKMLDDPAYKKEMEHKIMREFMNMDWLTTSPSYMHINIDANGKYSATPYVGSVSANYATETKNAFWTKGTESKGSAEMTPEEELLAYQKEMFDMLRGESTTDRRLFKTQLMNQYRVSMLSYLNQSYASDASSLSTFSSLI